MNYDIPLRVRFAPSPTGSLHVGGLRTALFVVLLARKTGGRAVLRIEDTDRERTVPGAEEQLRQDLEWAGLEFDESPWNDGEYGPYRQSERLSIYQEYARKLVDEGVAYRCFCTLEDLERMREDQVARGTLPRYDGRCRRLTPEQVQEKLERKLPFVIRQKIPANRTVVFEDLVRGEIRFETRDLDDHVLLKSDGYPTYHLAHVVDDHLMEVSMVVRGEEWISSAPKHILLFEALGWSAPPYAHLPLILDTERRKLSKRAGDVSAFVEEFRREGFLPQALINYVALLGWHPGGDRELFTFDELSELFDIDRVGKAGAVFDISKLLHINGIYIREMPEDEYISQCRHRLAVSDISADTNTESQLENLFLLIRDNVSKFSDVPDLLRPYVHETEDMELEARLALDGPGIKDLLTEVADAVSRCEGFDGLVFKGVVKAVGKELSRKGRDLWMPIRAALTGRTHGPELHRIAEILGKESIVKRLRGRVDHISR
jgi:nondiscriminating glutamyl-tRNA synthetase